MQTNNFILTKMYNLENDCNGRLITIKHLEIN